MHNILDDKNLNTIFQENESKLFDCLLILLQCKEIKLDVRDKYNKRPIDYAIQACNEKWVNTLRDALNNVKPVDIFDLNSK